ncbi:MAG: hypothetical protein K1W39_01540 [Lachnospiraceae bacterium]
MGFLSGITSFVKEHSDVIHGVLDVAGFIPGVGAVADLANAGLYAAEGNWLDAASSLASAIPGIGDTIALAKKTGKVLKGLKGTKALDKAKDMKSMFSALRGKAKTGASKAKNKGMKNRKEAFDNVELEHKEKCVNGRCFTGDTLVCTRDGYKPIKEIQKGDEVYSRNAETGETGLKEVEEVFCTTAHTIYHVWIDGKEEIKTTAYHPVYVEGQGWVTAINLREGDAIETVDGMACITKIVKERHEEPVPVYNFHVKEWVSYFVGEVRIYVHNTKGEHGNGSVPVKEKTKAKNGLFYKSNPKHTPGQSGNRHNAGVEPRNSLELFENSVSSADKPDARFTYDKETKTLHRFFNDGIDSWHWSGSTNQGSNSLKRQNVPKDIQKKFNLKKKGW